MWWLILYIIPMFICMIACLWIVKTEGKTTRHELFVMLLLFVPLLNIFAAIVCFIEMVRSEKFQKWLDVAIIDRSKVDTK